MLKRVILFLILSLNIAVAGAQKLTVNAPSIVEAGSQFRLTYTIDTHDVSGFRAGDIPEELEVLMGPSTSTQSSYQIINGKATSSATITYTYIIYASKNGKFTIPPAQVTVDGKTVTSNSVTITVEGTVDPNKQSQGGRGRNQGGAQQRIDNAGTAISAEDLFINVSASKRRVHEQEPILLTYKAYTRVGLNNLSNEAPDLKGFHVQEIPLPQQRSLKRETYKGKGYNTVVWRQYIIFPQMSGEITIPAIPFEAYVVQRNHNVDPFEAFFNGGSGYIEVKKKITAPALTITIEPLTDKPANFSGGVGTFSISATVDKTEVKANDPINMRVVVSGTGNLKLIKEPEVKFPQDFDKYDAKLTDKTKLTLNGVEGSMIYDILAVPRHQGKYEIPPVEFCFYNTKTNKYETVKTEGFQINVAKGEGGGTVVNYNNKEDLRELNKDIRYIKTGDAKVREANDTFFASAAYWTILAVLLLLFISLFVIFRQRAIANADITRAKGKKANKVATKRLKSAAKLMASGDASHFYDEVLRALWGYVSDKLNMPVEQLTRENISQRLADKNVEEETIRLFISALDECEFERYAPGDVAGNMNKTYDSAMTAITTIENTMRKTTRGAKTTAIVMIAMMLSLSANAQETVAPDNDIKASETMIMESDSVAQSETIVATKALADSAYADENYQQAIVLYEQLLANGVSAEIYYNLGNAYYRMDNITRAVLNYERALRLSPGDQDVRFNLQMAREKTIDRITPESEMFFVTWYHALINMMSVDGWARTALFALALAIVLALLYLFSERLILRKAGFFVGIMMLVVFILANLFASQQKEKLAIHSDAIVVSSAVSVKSTPADNGTDLFVLHEGTKVEIIDGSMDQWKKVKIADGKEGWIALKDIEVI